VDIHGPFGVDYVFAGVGVLVCYSTDVGLIMPSTGGMWPHIVDEVHVVVRG
jgi:hypothetical protein